MISVNQNGCYLLTLEIVGTLDIFTRPVYKQIIVHSLNHFINTKGLIVYGWCLMSSKLYLICQTVDSASLSEIRRDFKAFTCQKILEAIQNESEERRDLILSFIEKPSGFFSNKPAKLQCWKKITDPVSIDLRTPDSLAQHLEMIHNIPVKDRVVQFGSDYLYSSSRDYDGVNGFVKITKLSAVEQELNTIEDRKTSFRRFYNL